MTEATSYFVRIDERTFKATEHVSGAWNVDEQHVAPSFGLLVHLIEQEHMGRRDDRLVIGRLSYDILGVFTLDEIEIDIRVLRPGRTIELVEATLSQGGRAAVILRAWFMQPFDTAAIAANELPGIRDREDMGAGRITDEWPGGCVRSIDVRSSEDHPGRASSWVHPLVPLIEGEPTSDLARIIGMVDFANGLTPRQAINSVAFPNLDLTIHMIRQPSGERLGYDTSVSYGASGVGLTHTVLHDESGPFGVAAQSLTVRPLSALPQ